MSVAEPHETTDAEQSTVDQPTIEEEHQHHSYVSNAIPWYVRFIWLLFWIFGRLLRRDVLPASHPGRAARASVGGASGRSASSMTSTSSSRPNCDYCGLPVPQPLLQRRHPEPDGPRYCCYGCRFAAAISAEDGTEASARWTLTRLGLAIFFAMNVMVFTMTLWSYDVYEPDLSDPLTATFAQLLRYLCLLFSLPVLFLLGKPIADNAWTNLRAGVLSTDLLLMTGVVAAYVYSGWSVLARPGTGVL